VLAPQAVAVGHFMMTPSIALVLCKTLSVVVVLAALLVTTVFALILPEYCTDLVRGMGGRGCSSRRRVDAL
jgi:hypothetical protein